MLAVSAVTAWTDFIEDVFYGGINRDSAALSKTLGLDLPQHLTLPLCEALFTTNGFLDFRDGGDLRGKARKFLGGDHPLATLPNASTHAIDRLRAARNFIVHRSRVAKARYRTQVLRPLGVQKLVAPGRLLMARKSGRPRLIAYLEVMRSAVGAIYDDLD